MAVKFAFYARVISVILALALPTIAIYKLIPFPSTIDFVFLAAYSIGMGILIALIEMPSFCSCSNWCIITAKYTKFISGFWVARGIVYTGICAGGFAIYQWKSDAQTDSIWLVVAYAFLALAAALYFAATVMREDQPGALSDPSGAEKRGAAGAPKGTAGGGGLFGFGRRTQDAAVAAGVNAAAASVSQSMGKQLFGGGFGGSSASNSSGGEEGGESYGGGGHGNDDVEAAESARPSPSAPAPAPSTSGASASLFTGGGLFGGAKNKYGYSSDTPEANPFMG